MSFSFLFCPIAIASEATQPQLQWSKTYGPYRGGAVIQTSDGGYAIAGSNAFGDIRGYGEFPALLIKTDSSGNQQWAKTYRYEEGITSSAFSVVQTSDSGYALFGEGWLLKTDSEGNVQWIKSFGYFYRGKAIQTSDGGYAVAGTFPPVDGQSAILIKTDENGDQLWNRTFAVDWAWDVVETNDKNYAIAGQWNNKGWFAEIGTEGNLRLNQTYGDGEFTSIAQTQDGGYILSGRVSWTDTGLLSKINSMGNLLWQQSFSGEDGAYWLRAVVEVPDRAYIAVGSISSNTEGYILIIKTTIDGSALWNVTYGGSEDDSANSIVSSDEATFVVVGRMNDAVWMSKFGDNVNSSMQSTYIIASTIVALLSAILLLFVLIQKRKRRQHSKTNENRT